MQLTVTMQAVTSHLKAEVVENAHVRRTMTVTASKPFDGSIKLEGLYEATDPNGRGLGANIGYNTQTNDLAIGVTAKYDKNDVSADISAEYNGHDTAFKFSIARDF